MNNQELKPVLLTPMQSIYGARFVIVGSEQNPQGVIVPIADLGYYVEKLFSVEETDSASV